MNKQWWVLFLGTLFFVVPVKAQEMQVQLSSEGVDQNVQALRQEMQVQGKDPCFLIKDYEILDGKIMRRKIKKIVRPLIGKCVKVEELDLSLHTINDLIVQKGYVTSRVVLEPQAISEGKIKLHVLEGLLENVEFDELSQGIVVWDKIKIHSAFLGMKNDVLNLRDIEQALAQMNQVRSNDITMKIVPSQKTAYSKVILSNIPDESQFRARVSADNAGADSTGKYNVRLNLEEDNLLELNDTWTASYAQTVKRKNSSRRSHNFIAGVNFAYGAWNFNVNGVKSEYNTIIPATNQEIKNAGTGFHQNYKIERQLFKNAVTQTSVSTQLSLKDNKSFISDVESVVGSRKQTVLKAGLAQSLSLPIGFFSLSSSYHRGLAILGSKKDEGELDDFTPRAQFEKVDLNLSYYKSFGLFSHNFYFKSSVFGQYAFNPLFSSEQIVIGDAYSVRGFKERSGFGDQGIYGTNDLGLMLPGFATERWGINKLLRQTEVFAGFDAGAVRHFGGKQANQNQGQSVLTAWACGIRHRGRFSFDLTYGQSVNTEDFIGTSQEIYANISMELF